MDFLSQGSIPIAVQNLTNSTFFWRNSNLSTINILNEYWRHEENIKKKDEKQKNIWYLTHISIFQIQIMVMIK